MAHSVANRCHTPPPAAEEAEVAGRLGGHPGDEEGDPAEPETKGAAALPAGQARDPLDLIPLPPAVDGAAAAEEDCLDVRPRAALGQQQEDVGAEAGFGLGLLAVDLEQFVALRRRQKEPRGQSPSVGVDSGLSSL
jgi:hypothetical protein